MNLNAKYNCHPYIVDARLGGTRVELGGWPPVLLCFEQLYDRDVVLNRATCLERTGLMITEDMTRSLVELVTKVWNLDAGTMVIRDGWVG